MALIITSNQNERARFLRSLRQKSARRETGLHFIEGERLVFDALSSGALIERCMADAERQDIVSRLEETGVPFDLASSSVMRSVCDTETPQGVCAAVKTPDTSAPAEFPHGLIIALDALQDPGNLGTVLRTADAFGAAGVLIGEGCTDPFSPKALRAAMGSTYHLPVWQAGLANVLPRLASEGRSLVCGHLAGSESLPPLSKDRVLVIGNEGSGVSDEVASLCTLYRLPMPGRAESLNAAVAAAILIYKLSCEI